MKKFTLTVMLAVFGILGQLPADESKDEAWARAQAAIAIAKAKAKQPKVVALTKPLPYAEAVKVAKSERKPLIVAVGLNCSGLCTELRPEFVTCHEAKFEDNATPRLMLLMHDKDGVLFKVAAWPICPAAAEVKAEVMKNRKRLDPQAAFRQDLLEAAILEMFALEFDGQPCPTCPQGFVNVNGTCQPAPNQAAGSGGARSSGPVPAPYAAQGYQWMPQPYVTELRIRGEVLSRDGRFGHRFRAFRSRVRCAMGLERHQDGQLPYSATLQAPAQPAAPEVFGAVQGPLGSRLIKAYLVKHGVPGADLDKLEAKYGAGSGILGQLLKLLLEEGAPLVIEWLKTLIG